VGLQACLVSDSRLKQRREGGPLLHDVSE
jgi:hypothetical protein